MNAAPRFHPEVLPPAQQVALRGLAPVASAEGFYLAGGTALAIQLGHRRSLDFDWFRQTALSDPHALAVRLKAAGLSFQTVQVAQDTLHGTTAGVATSFFRYGYPPRMGTVTGPKFGCEMAAPADIASMKLSAVAQRGARKDVAHLLVALSYFEDAEREPMPDMLWSVEWAAIKSEIQTWVKVYVG